MTKVKYPGPYPPESLDPNSDDGTIVSNKETFEEQVVGHRIVKAVKSGFEFYLTLDSGRIVKLVNSSDCCAGTWLEKFVRNPEAVDHVITGVGTTEEYTKWHVYADLGDVLTMTVGWTCGNPFYYGYGFEILVKDPVASQTWSADDGTVQAHYDYPEKWKDEF